MSTAAIVSNLDLDGYDIFAANLKKNFLGEPGPFFTTNATGLWEAYLNNLPEARRQIYNCKTCQKFIENFGGLVSVDPKSGRTNPVFWNLKLVDCPEFFRRSMSMICRIVQKAKITGVYLSSESIWGTPEAGGWSHLHVQQSMPCKVPLVNTLSQEMAAKTEEYKMLLRGLDEFSKEVAIKAKSLLETESLYRSEKCLGVATWLLKLHEDRESVKGSPAKNNLTWLAVASAPPGFCHVRSTMIGTLLEDLTDKHMSFEHVAARFKAKMNPLQYQRPTSEPSEANIKRAEEIVAKLAAAGSLARRYARLEDVQAHALWKPAPVKANAPSGKEKDGVFSHLKKASKPVGPVVSDAPPVTMTWEKFSQKVLPTAEKIEVQVPGHGSFSALTTAVNADAPPIFQWDSEQERNPVAWYFYSNGSQASDWNLRSAGAFSEVTAIVLKPTQWGTQPLDHFGRGIFILIRDCRDMKLGKAGLGIFPETLKSEFHEIRKTMEAFSRKGELEGAEEASACGLGYSNNEKWNVTLQVTSSGIVTRYLIDRID